MKLFCPRESKTKIIIWFYSGYKLTRYSYLREDKKFGKKIAKKRMLNRLAFGKYRGQWKTLEVYNNHTKALLEKYIDGNQII